MTKFMFATGIENSYPTIAGPNGENIRIDEMAKTQHYERWKEDFELLNALDIHYLRYGPPLYKTHTGPGRYDWGFSDETFTALRKQNVTVIADLCHFGVPDWLQNFQNPDFPPLFAEYAGAFAKRYPWVRFYTPVNEIFVAATFSAHYGWWNERRSDDRSFVTALNHLCRANILAMHAILNVQPNAIFIQSESSEFFHPAEPKCIPYANFLNQKRFLSLDLTYGESVDVMMYEYLRDNGMTREDYHWYFDNHLKPRCVMGNDYYVTNEHLVNADNSTTAAGEIFGYYVITRQYYDRYKLPVMHTETNIAEPDSVRWLYKQWANLHQLKSDGVPIIGFTWYSLIDQVDWDSALRNNGGVVNPLGLADMNRNIRDVGRAYEKLISQWRDILPTESHSLGMPI